MKTTSYLDQAIKLRKQGFSYNLIQEQVPVSKSTLSVWLRDVPYTPNKTVVARIGSARAKSGKAQHEKKQASYAAARILAQSDLANNPDPQLHALGLGLYMGEGEKNDTVGLANSDPLLVQLFVRWLRDIYGVTVDHLTVAVHTYRDTDHDACEQYWSRITGVPRSQFGALQVDRRQKHNEMKRNRLPFGTAHVRVRSNGKKEFGVLLSRRIEESGKLFSQNRGIS